MGSIMRMIRRQIPDIYIHSLEIGNGIVSDTLNGFFMPIPEQVSSTFLIILLTSIISTSDHFSLQQDQIRPTIIQRV